MKQGWEYKKLGEVCEIFGRIGFRGYKREDYVESEKEGAISLSPSNIISGRLDYSKNTYISWYKYEESPEIKIFEGDVLLVKTASVGKSAIVDTLPHAATINPQFVVFKNIQANNQYLFYSINSEGFLVQLKSITSGSSVPTLSQKALAELQIPLPPLPIQQSIVAELDEINNLLSLKRKELETYDKLAQSLFYEMFGDPVENEKGWEVKKLSSITTKIGSGATPKGGNESYKAEGISLIRSLNVHNNEFLYKDLAHIDNMQADALSNVEVFSGDVLLNITGASVARCCIVPEDIIPARVNQHVCIIRTMTDKALPIYLNRLLTNGNYQICLLALARSKAATREALPKSLVDNLQIPLPPLPLQQTFATRIEAIEAQKANVKAAIEKLETLLVARMQYWFE